MQEIYAEGFPFIGNAVGEIIMYEEQARLGLVLGVDGEWYDPNDLVEEESNPDISESSSDSKSESSSKSETESDSDYSDKDFISDEEIYKHLRPRKGFHYPILDELDLLLRETRNDYELFLECVNMARDKIPPEIWAKSQREFVSPESNMYQYLKEMGMNIESDEEKLSYIHFRAAARAYDACQVTNKTHDLNIMHKIFETNLQAIKNSLEN